MSVDWDNHDEICSSYEDNLNGQRLVASKKVVEHEAANIIRGNRTSLSQFVEKHSRDDFDNFGDLRNKLENFDRNSSSLVDYADHRKSKFSDFIAGDIDSIDLLELIDSDFDQPSMFIQKIKSGNSIIEYLNYSPSRHLSRYGSLYSRLANKVKNEDDLEVLLDSHHLTEEENIDVAFLSFDKHDITQNKDKIERTLSRVYVFNPSEHI